MSAPKHTQGPWRIDDRTRVVTASGDIVAKTYSPPSELPAYAERNARLIAAAPDLARALSDGLDVLEDAAPEIAERAREALRKAGVMP